MSEKSGDKESVQIQFLTEYLQRYLSDARKEKLEKVLDQRTHYVTLVMEDIYQSQNASAAVRSAECLGLQQVYIIENDHRYKVNRKVLRGAEKWIDFIQFKAKGINNTDVCFKTLKEEGYRIVVTSPSPDSIPLEEVPIDRKVALLLGSELTGVSEYALQHADHVVRIPMYGFTESFNVSASAAICLEQILNKVRTSSVQWNLTKEEKNILRLNWLRKMVKRSDLLEKEALRA